MRIMITEDEFGMLKKIADYSLIDGSEIDCLNGIIDKIIEDKNKEVSIKKVKAAAKATKVRSDKARLKIEKALNMMRLEGKPISVYLVSKNAGVSYNTANKYAHIIEPTL